MADGTELPADLVVYATGYGSMNGWCADLISQEVADRVGKVWGLGSDTTKDPGPWEGELRNMWKPTQQEALWMHGGNLHQSRFHSLFLALQLKARAWRASTTPVYGLQEVHHTELIRDERRADSAHSRQARTGAAARRSHVSQAPKRFIFYLPPSAVDPIHNGGTESPPRFCGSTPWHGAMTPRTGHARKARDRAIAQSARSRHRIGATFTALQ